MTHDELVVEGTYIVDETIHVCLHDPETNQCAAPDVVELGSGNVLTYKGTGETPDDHIFYCDTDRNTYVLHADHQSDISNLRPAS